MFGVGRLMRSSKKHAVASGPVTANWNVLQAASAGAGGAVHANGTSGWNGFAVATGQSKNGNWQLDFTVDNPATIGFAIGWTTAYSLSDDSYLDVQFGLVILNGGDVRSNENGAWSGNLFNCVAGDIMTVKNAGGTVTYLLNGVVKGTSGTAASGTFMPIVGLNASTGTAGVATAQVTI